MSRSKTCVPTSCAANQATHSSQLAGPNGRELNDARRRERFGSASLRSRLSGSWQRIQDARDGRIVVGCGHEPGLEC